MKFNSITFRNFRTYQNEKTITFNDGMNLIFADNGSGKSTIIQAIRLILFGHNQAKNLDSLVNWNSESKNFYLELNFNIEGNTYVASWEYDKKGSPSSKRTITKNGEQIVEGAEACKTYFSEMFDIGLMDNALFSRQNLNNIIEVTDSERSEVLKKIKDVDFTNKIKKEIDPEIESNESEATDLSVEIRALESKTYNLQETYEVPMDESEVSSSEKELELTKKEIQIAQESNEKLKKLEDELDHLIVKKTRIEKKEEKKKESLSDIKEKLEKEEGRVIEDKSDSLVSEKDSLSVDSELKENEEKYDKLLSEKESQLKKKTEEISKITVERTPPFDDSELERLKKEITEKTVEIKNHKEKQELISKGVCPTCNRPFEEGHEHKEQNSIDVLNEELQELKDNKERELKRKEEYEQRIEENNLLKDKKSELKHEISSLESEISSLEKEKKSSHQAIIDSYEQKVNLLDEKIKNEKERYESEIKHREQAVKDLQERIADLKSEIKDIEKDISEINSEVEEKENQIEECEVVSTDDLEEKKNKLSSKIKKYYDVISKNEVIEKNNKELEEEQSIDSRTLKRLQKKKDKIQTRILKLKEAKTLLQKELPAYIISQSIQSIQDGINTFIDNVYTKPLEIEFKLNKSSIAMNYGGKKSKIPVKGGLSGAESKMVQIGFISKFNHDLGLNCIFLDEPDENISENNSEKLYEILGEMTSEFSQVFIITHQERMKEYLINNYESTVISLT